MKKLIVMHLDEVLHNPWSLEYIQDDYNNRLRLWEHKRTIELVWEDTNEGELTSIIKKLYLPSTKFKRMNIATYMSVIPGIIYGMALVELIRIYRHKSQYWETNLLGVFLFLIIISDRYKTFPYIDQLFENMFVFTVYMISPLVFMQACHSLTPELEEDVALAHFKSRRKKFFLLLSVFTGINVVIEIFLIDQNMLFLRIAIVLLFLLNGFIDNLWLRIGTYAIIIIAIAKVFWPSIETLL